MMWAHSGPMHWTSKDLDGVTMDVVRKDDGKWLFTAIGTITGTPVASTTYSHPIEAMRAGRNLWEQFNGKQSEETAGKTQTYKPKTKSSIQTDH